MRRLAAALLVGLTFVGLMAPTAPALTTAAPAPTGALTAPAAAAQHDEPPQHDRGREERTKPLPARSILLTLAVILGSGFAVVLAGLGYFSPGRDGDRG